MSFALERLRVTEVGCGLSGAFCGRVMAALGATVWKVEPPEGDPCRRARVGAPGPPLESGSALFDFLNGGKKSIAVPWGTAAGDSQITALAAASDVVIYSEAEGPCELGRVSELKCYLPPSGVLIVIDSFGGVGPYAKYQAVPMTYQALGGYMYMMGEPDREPLAFPGQHPYYLAGLYGLIAGLTALQAKRNGATQSGKRVAVSIHEVIPTLTSYTIATYTYEGRIWQRHGNRWPDIHPLAMYPCADGWFVIGLPWEHWWERFCIMIGHHEMVEDPRFADAYGRVEYSAEVDAVISQWLKDKTRAEVTEKMREWRLPLGACLELNDVLEHDQLRARRYFEEIQEQGKTVLVPGLPFRREHFPWQIGPVPRHGEHTEQVLASISASDGRGLLPCVALEDSVAALTQLEPKEHASDTPPPPLSGLRVLDFTWVWAGPLATRILADVGAEVIKVEYPSPVGRSSASWSVRSFHKLNRNKRSIALDLGQPEATEVVEALVRVSDVVIDNFSPRVMSNLGFGYRKLASLNPRIIVVSMPAFGSDGPYRDDVCIGASLEAMTGLASLLGYDDDQPYVSSFAYPDPVSSLWAVSAILSAFEWRHITGKGCHIDISQYEGTVTMLGEYLIELQRTGLRPARRGNRHPEWVPHGCYPCAGVDHWITIAIRDDAEWKRLIEVIGTPEWTGEERFRQAEGRRRHEAELDRRLSEWTTAWDAEKLMDRLQRGGIAAGYVTDAPTLLRDPQLQARGFFVRLNQPGVGGKPFPSLPFRIEGIAIDNWRPSPELGQDTQAVLEEVLGMPKAKASMLVEKLHRNLSRPR